MKKDKTYYPLIAGAVIAVGGLFPITLAGEKEIAQVEQAAAPAKNDHLIGLIEEKIIKPLNVQAERNGLMSRRGPTFKTTYQLVDTSKSSDGDRTFSVVMKRAYFSKKKAAESSDFLKLRLPKGSSEILVGVKDQWVTLDEHPILKRLLPKPAPQKKIVP